MKRLIISDQPFEEIVAERDALKAENDRLRAALEVYADRTNWLCFCGDWYFSQRYEYPPDIASEALGVSHE